MASAPAPLAPTEAPRPLSAEEAQQVRAWLASGRREDVKRAQARLGVTPDGIVGPQTRAAVDRLAPGAGAPAFLLTVDGLARVLRAGGVNAVRAATNAPDLLAAMRRYGIDTRLRVGHFLAQVLIESGWLKYREEIATGSAYEGRRDLGNTERGDGRRFKGRGFIQLTGRLNYSAYDRFLLGKGVKAGVLRNPEKVATEFAADSAGYFWERERLNAEADAGDNPRQVQRISRAVNRGTPNRGTPANHERERIEAFRQVMAGLNKEGVA